MHNASELRLTFAGHPDYSIWVPETLTVTLPATTILSNHSLVASPPLVLWAEPGTLEPRGALVDIPFETTVQLGATTLELTLVGASHALELRFKNGRRNVHLQGAAWPGGAPVDLQLRLAFGDDPDVAFLVEALGPQLSAEEARAALAAHGGDVDRAVAALLG